MILAVIIIPQISIITTAFRLHTTPILCEYSSLSNNTTSWTSQLLMCILVQIVKCKTDIPVSHCTFTTTVKFISTNFHRDHSISTADIFNMTIISETIYTTVFCCKCWQVQPNCGLFGFVWRSSGAWCWWIPVVNDLGQNHPIYYARHDICCDDCNVSCFLNWSEYSRHSSTKQHREGNHRQLACTGIAVVSQKLYKLSDHNHKDHSIISSAVPVNYW